MKVRANGKSKAKGDIKSNNDKRFSQKYKADETNKNNKYDESYNDDDKKGYCKDNDKDKGKIIKIGFIDVRGNQCSRTPGV